MFAAALNEAGVKGDEAIFVDDRGDRIEGAEALGMKVVVFDGKIDDLKQIIASFK